MASPHVFCRRRFLRLLATAGLGAPLTTRAAEERTTLEFLVAPKGWNAAPAEVRAGLAAAAQEIWRWCPGEQIRAVRIDHRGDFPQTDFLHDWRGRIRIGLSAAAPNWAQMVFQFGHEFVHALAQHSAAARRAWRTPRHANLWFEESLCETASLFTLRRLAAVGDGSSRAAVASVAAGEFGKFAEERLARPDHQLPAGRSFLAWFAENEPDLRQNAALRARNVIVARQLLPLFEAEPAGWRAACYLNLGQRTREKSRAQYFAEWQAASPAHLRPILARVAAVFAPAWG